MASRRPASRPDEAEALFEQFLVELEEGATGDFEAFVAAHPARAGDLRRLHLRWRALEERVEGLLPGPLADESFFHGQGGSRAGEGAPEAAELAARLALRPGRVLGDFRLVRVLGGGGMGQVWEAEQVSLGRRVALKLIRPGRESENLGRLLVAEARAGGRVTHPGIVAVHAAGEIDGVPYIAQELVDQGFTLADFLSQMRELPRLAPEYDRQIARLLAEVAEAVHAAHAAGVLHRDLKPQNILIGPDDRPRVSDFGLAWRRDDTPAKPGLVGTFPYMSPEQALGKDELDARSDVFSLGAVLYEALTLRRAFEGDSSTRILARIVGEDPPEPRTIRSSVPRELATIAGKALQKSRGDRYQSLREVAEDLRRYLRSEPIRARPEGLLGRAVKWSRRHPGKSTGLLLGSAALLVISALLLREVDLRHAAEESATLAAQRAEEVLRNGYLANLFAAALQLDQDDPAEARRRLAACTPERRDWEWRHLSLRADLALRHVQASAVAVAASALSGDGELLATGGPDGTLVLWGLADGRERRRASVAAAITALALSDDGSVLVVGTSDGAVLAGAGGALAELGRQEGPVAGVALSADGIRVAAGWSDGTARVWSRTTSEPIVLLPGGGSAIVSVALSRDGLRLVTGERYGAVQVWDESSGEAWAMLVGTGGQEVVVAVDDTARTIAAGTSDGWVRVLDGVTGELLLLFAAHDFRLSALALDGRGRRLVTASAEDNTLRLWDLPAPGPTPPPSADGTPRSRPSPSLLRHAGLTGHEGRLVCLALSRDGTTLAVGGSAGVASVFDGRTRGASVPLRGASGSVTALAVSADGRRFVTASLFESDVLVWDGRSGRVSAVLQGTTIGVPALALSADGERLAFADYQGHLQVWDGPAHTSAPAWEGDEVSALALDGRGTLLVTGSVDGTLLVRDVATGTERARLGGHDAGVTAVAVSADGSRAASSSADGTVFLWDGLVPPGRLLRRGGGFDDGPLALSADGRRVAWASQQDDRILVWDADTGAAIARLTGYRNDVAALSFSADGRRLFSASHQDDSIRVWDPARGDLLALLAGHEGAVRALAFSADGRRLISAGADRRVRVWESELSSARELWHALAEGP